MEYQVVMTASPFPKRDEEYTGKLKYQEQKENINFLDGSLPTEYSLIAKGWLLVRAAIPCVSVTYAEGYYAAFLIASACFFDALARAAFGGARRMTSSAKIRAFSSALSRLLTRSGSIV